MRRMIDDVRFQSQYVQTNCLRVQKDNWDHDETGCEVETADVAVCSSQCAYLRIVTTTICRVYLNMPILGLGQ